MDSQNSLGDKSSRGIALYCDLLFGHGMGIVVVIAVAVGLMVWLLVSFCRRLIKRFDNAYRAGQMCGRLCPSCTHEVGTAARHNEAKTAMADDLVRGTSEASENPTP